MTCPFSHDDAAYIFGALSTAERLDFERHLAGCGQCSTAVREMAGLPGLLGRVDASVLENPTAEEPVPETLLPSLFREARRSRGRRTLTAAGLAAAAVVTVAAASVPVVLSQQGDGGSRGQAGPPASIGPLPSSQARPMAPTGKAPMQASLAMQTVAWGTRLDLTCTYGHYFRHSKLTPSATYVLSVRTINGRTEQVGTWQAVDGTMHLSAATAAHRADIASVEVRTTDGRVLLRLSA